MSIIVYFLSSLLIELFHNGHILLLSVMFFSELIMIVTHALLTRSSGWRTEKEQDGVDRSSINSNTVCDVDDDVTTLQ